MGFVRFQGDPAQLVDEGAVHSTFAISLLMQHNSGFECECMIACCTWDVARHVCLLMLVTVSMALPLVSLATCLLQLVQCRCSSEHPVTMWTDTMFVLPMHLQAFLIEPIYVAQPAFPDVFYHSDGDCPNCRKHQSCTSRTASVLTSF
jgi:hypothetical protein